MTQTENVPKPSFWKQKKPYHVNEAYHHDDWKKPLQKSREKHPMQTCRICSYEWWPKKNLPAQCPRCKRYDWNGKNYEKIEKQFQQAMTNKEGNAP